MNPQLISVKSVIVLIHLCDLLIYNRSDAKSKLIATMYGICSEFSSAIIVFGFTTLTEPCYVLVVTVFDWIVVDRAGDGFPFANSSSNGLVVTSTITVLYITAPPLFLGAQFRSYGQRLHLKVSAWKIPRRMLAGLLVAICF